MRTESTGILILTGSATLSPINLFLQQQGRHCFLLSHSYQYRMSSNCKVFASLIGKQTITTNIKTTYFVTFPWWLVMFKHHNGLLTTCTYFVMGLLISSDHFIIWLSCFQMICRCSLCIRDINSLYIYITNISIICLFTLPTICL